MADPVTDSRLPGFNPEVEESHTATDKAIADAAAGPQEPARHFRCPMCGGMFAEDVKPCPHCGAEYDMTNTAPAEARD